MGRLSSHAHAAGVSLVLVSACVFLSPSITFAAPITIDVKCDGNKVGAITVDSSGSGITGGFTSTVGGPPATLKDAAIACKEDHFNWYQVRVGGDPPPKDAKGNTPTIPFVDPPPGGWDYGWADDLPWYWDEYGPADGKNPDGTAYDNDYLLSKQVTTDTLKYADFPAGGDKTFNTWLVSLNADGSFHSWHEGFTWQYKTADNKVTTFSALANSPTDAQYKNIIGGFVTSVPEPSSITLVAVGLVASWRSRKRLLRFGA